MEVPSVSSLDYRKAIQAIEVLEAFPRAIDKLHTYKYRRYSYISDNILPRCSKEGFPYKVFCFDEILFTQQ